MDLRALRYNYQVKRQNLEKCKSRDFVKLRTAKKNSRDYRNLEFSVFRPKLRMENLEIYVSRDT
jgi:hypothetical protein